MKFALFTHIAWPEGTDQKKLMDQAAEQVIHGESLGFHSAWIAEHHFSRYGIGSSPLVVAGAIAAQTKTIRLGTAVLIPPLHNPIRLAEDTATVDLISNGRLDVGFGRGSAAYEFNAYGVDQTDNRAMFQEGIQTITDLWTTPDYSHDGKYYKVDHATLVPSPIQKPHPPIYIAVSRTIETLKYVASTGYPICIGVTSDTVNALALCQQYEELSLQAGHNVPMSDIPFFRYFYVGETEEQVKNDTRPALQWAADMVGWRSTFKSGSEVGHRIDDWRKTRTEAPPDLDHLSKNRAVMGTPEQIVAQLKELQSQGIGYFGCNFAFGGMPHDKIMRSMALFSKEVMPHFE
jgi:alkanesulfonate monooxygenase SsuD/methylene tetrahydromethanopterin reductase-like flavin-dependent oxidoreductase (luciferase family)